MIAELIAALYSIGVKPTAQDIADALWLARYLDESKQPSLPSRDTTTWFPPEFVADDTPEAKAAEQARTKAEVYIPSHNDGGGEHLVRLDGGYPMRSPSGSSLHASLDIGRALRPLKLKLPSRSLYVLDEERTADQIAETHLNLPVLRPAPSRWLDVALVVDVGRSMCIWHRSVAQFKELLDHHGAFRNVRAYGLVNSEQAEGELGLVPWPPQGLDSERAADTRQIIDPLGRRLIIVASDCIAPAWYSGAMSRVLAAWERTGPVVILQMLPPRLWKRTALSSNVVRLRAPRPAAPNQALIADAPRNVRQKYRRHYVPVITLEPRWIGTWARMVAGTTGAKTPAFAVPMIADRTIRAAYRHSATPVNVADNRDLTATQRVELFAATASPMAQRLAGYFAAAPLTLPVMRLIQRVMLARSDQGHLAEFLFGGLVEQVTHGDERTYPDAVEYDFVGGVRDVVLNSVRASDALQVLDHVSQYVAERIGHRGDFQAVLADPSSAGPMLTHPQARPFATVAIQVLRRLGGHYAEIAAALDGATRRLGAGDDGASATDDRRDNHVLGEGGQEGELGFGPSVLTQDATPYDGDIIPTHVPVTGRLFYGRHRERQSITEPAGVVLVYGARCSGMTSLFQEIVQESHADGADYVALYLNLAFPPKGLRFSSDVLWRMLADALEDAFPLTTTGSRETATYISSRGAVDENTRTRPKQARAVSKDEKYVTGYIKAWLGSNPKQRILLLLDEAQEFLIVARRSNSRESQTLASLLVLRTQTRDRFKVVLNGYHEALRAVRNRSHPLSAYSPPLYVGRLRNRQESLEAQDVIRDRFGERGYIFESPDLVERILQRSDNYPSSINAYCNQLLRRLTELRSGGRHVGDKQRVIKAEHVDDIYFNHGWREYCYQNLLRTLNLEYRYSMIAYVIADTSMKGGANFTIQWIDQEIKVRWPGDFMATANGIVPTIIDEMIQLNLLEARNENEYLLRNLEIIPLDKLIRDILNQLRRHGKDPKEATLSARELQPDNDIIRTTMTQQVSSLRSRLSLIGDTWLDRLQELQREVTRWIELGRHRTLAYAPMTRILRDWLEQGHALEALLAPIRSNAVALAPWVRQRVSILSTSEGVDALIDETAERLLHSPLPPFNSVAKRRLVEMVYEAVAFAQQWLDLLYVQSSGVSTSEYPTAARARWTGDGSIAVPDTDAQSHEMVASVSDTGVNSGRRGPQPTPPEERQRRRREALEGLTVGEWREGHVTSVVPFGAFVDLGGIDGLVHISQLGAGGFVQRAEDVVQPGQTVRVRIVEVDRDRERVGLSMREQRPRRRHDTPSVDRDVPSPTDPPRVAATLRMEGTRFSASADKGDAPMAMGEHIAGLGDPLQTPTAADTAVSAVPTTQATPKQISSPRRRDMVDATVLSISKGGGRITVRLHTGRQEELSADVPVALRYGSGFAVGQRTQVRIEDIDRQGRVTRISKNR